MAERVAAVQALVIGLLFAWAGIWKICFPQARALAARSALGKLLPTPQLAQTAHLAVGVGEITIAVLLLAPPARGWAMWLASLFSLGFLGYLGLAWRVAPDRPCACMGGQPNKISWRSLARATTVLVLTLIGWLARDYWAAALKAAPWTVLVIVAEVAMLWALSPEFGGMGARFGKQLMRETQLRLDPACTRVALNWNELERGLRRTRVFQHLAPRLQAITDRWREGCWGFIAYGLSYDDQPATAVFAVPARFDPHEVSAAVVADADNAILLRLAATEGRQAHTAAATSRSEGTEPV
jgi:hypothetical protein